MGNYVEKTIIVSSPKRSGGTLLTNLFDFHPGIMSFHDEGFFWEHVYNYQETGKESLFVDIFRFFEPELLARSLIDRDILLWIDGVMKLVIDGKMTEVDLGFKKEVFIRSLKDIRRSSSVSDVWDSLVKAYAKASSARYLSCRTAFIFGGDWGRGIIATKSALKNCRCIFIMRDPYLALDSLKKSRIDWNRKILFPMNFAEVLNYYFFFWNNRSKILDDRTILIRFEDLVADTKKTMKSVAAHVGVEYTDNLITPTLLGKPWRGESSFRRANKGIDRRAISRKVETLTGEEKEMIRVHLKPILKYFDYKDK